MTWDDELTAMLAEARGDLAVYLALVALRQTEHGGPGREFGVLSERADSYALQLHIAANSLRNAELRCAGLCRLRDPHSGLYTDDLLTAFSHHWAPLGAPNDPENLNANHASNLVACYHKLSSPIVQALLAVNG